MNRQTFTSRLRERPFLFDGAMGTLLHSRGISMETSFDGINLTQPAIVADIHRAYINAGADIIETNSFGANRYKLVEYGLQHQVRQINRAAVNIARRVIGSAFREVWLAGSVGPLGVRLAPLGRVSLAEAAEAFNEQIEALLAEGVDLLVLETMSDLHEMETAVTVARQFAPELPIITQMTFTRDDRTLLGHAPSVVAERLAALDVDAIGVNCSGGPAQVLRLLRIMHQIAPDKLLAAAPNAGWPEQTERGRVLYPATPDYFWQYTHALVEAGAVLVGGCCGTNEAHIAAMRHALDHPLPSPIPLPDVQIVTQAEEKTAVLDPPTQLAQNLGNGRYVVTVEMSPPKGIGTQRLIEGAHMLKEAGANLLNLADSPLARLRMSAWAAAHLVQKSVGLETVLHFPTRGRNLLRIQGDLLAAYAMGIRNLFVTMGDPTQIGDYPEAMDSYDIVPTGLIHLIKQQFNSGRDKAGNAIDQPTNFMVGCALSLTPADPEREMKLLRRKIRNGADFALTQPVFDPVAAKQFVDLYGATYEEKMLPIIVGIKPLYNGRNAEFLHHEVPGMSIPKLLRQRMATATDPQQEGVAIAQEILEAVRPFTQGVYLMPAFGRYDLVANVMDGLRGK
ncbi:bifunctional homocysteine S-methyltransferase/methylenetetrahydrofolate reductase [Candidatus Leptofilum sp.]|uniref:bifunctional homocysteine S-methyltransferase/methylenetetrahydrofolate reductase n=1 Tax=Candidatus Leptofilum sp. TaxID=3241576 RepID=UPI003B5B934D